MEPERRPLHRPARGQQVRAVRTQRVARSGRDLQACCPCCCRRHCCPCCCALASDAVSLAHSTAHSTAQALIRLLLRWCALLLGGVWLSRGPRPLVARSGGAHTRDAARLLRLLLEGHPAEQAPVACALGAVVGAAILLIIGDGVPAVLQVRPDLMAPPCARPAHTQGGRERPRRWVGTPRRPETAAAAVWDHR